ncbi:MAG: hypothetical protein H6774_02005 [Pseudomonadales bacterium]|nr:hypothetical protein [Pseudomonadales bacterium]
MKMVTLNTKITPSQHQWLKEQAQQNKMSLAETLRQIVKKAQEERADELMQRIRDWHANNNLTFDGTEAVDIIRKARDTRYGPDS